MCNIITNSFSNISRKNKEVEYYHSTNNPKLSSSPNIQTLSLEHILLKKTTTKNPPKKPPNGGKKSSSSVNEATQLTSTVLLLVGLLSISANIRG